MDRLCAHAFVTETNVNARRSSAPSFQFPNRIKYLRSREELASQCLRRASAFVSNAHIRKIIPRGQGTSLSKIDAAEPSCDMAIWLVLVSQGRWMVTGAGS